MSKKDEKELLKLNPFMLKRLQDSRKKEREYEATLDPRQFTQDDSER